MLLIVDKMGKLAIVSCVTCAFLRYKHFGQLINHSGSIHKETNCPIALEKGKSVGLNLNLYKLKGENFGENIKLETQAPSCIK